VLLSRFFKRNFVLRELLVFDTKLCASLNCLLFPAFPTSHNSPRLDSDNFLKFSLFAQLQMGADSVYVLGMRSEVFTAKNTNNFLLRYEAV
jgi:hypothetical protein